MIKAKEKFGSYASVLEKMYVSATINLSISYCDTAGRRLRLALMTHFNAYLMIYRLFVCQDENKNEPEEKSFRSFWIKPVKDEPGLEYYDTLKDWFVRHA